jgi:TatD DNase family protein
MIIDTHSHISFKAYNADREEVIKRTREEGVVCIDVGTKYETSKAAVELAEKNEGIYAAIGMHPIHIKTDLLKLKTDEEEGAFVPLGEEYDAEKYRKLALSNDRVVAIGEIGLDYYYKPKTTSRLEQFKELQRKVFIEQLDLAKELDLPVIIHCRMAHTDVIEIISNFQFSISNEFPNQNDQKLRGVIHCFTGNWEQAQKYMELGFYLGINGIIFKFDINEVIKKAPLDKILVETDCPYLTPLPAVALAKAGIDGYVRNEPIFVKHVIQKIAELKGMSFEEIASATTANTKKLFRI